MAKKIKSYSETELIDMFGLTRLAGNNKFSLMRIWTDAVSSLTASETEYFDVMTVLIEMICSKSSLFYENLKIFWKRNYWINKEITT
jgi:hypothetical protein